MTPYLPNGEKNLEYWDFINEAAKWTSPDIERFYDSQELEADGYALESRWDGEKFVIVGVVAREVE